MKAGQDVYYQGRKALVTDTSNYPIIQLYVDGKYKEAHKDDITSVATTPRSTVIPRRQVLWDDGISPRTSTKESVVSYEPVLTNQTKIKEERGNVKMNIKRLFGEFGKVASGEVVLTFDSKVAVRRNADEYVRYDAEKEQIVNHLGMVIEKASKFFYILPVTEVEAGDVIKFKNQYFQVIEVLDNGSLKAINLAKGTASTICKETNAFGINFYYKVTSLFKADGSAQEGFNPLLLTLITDKGGKFEDLLPLMMLGGQGADFAKNPLLLMSLLGEGSSDMSDILMLQALSGSAQGGADFASNPLLMMSLLGEEGSDMKDILMLQAMSGTAGTAGTFNPLMLLALKK